MVKTKDRPLQIVEGAPVGDGFSTCIDCGVKLDEDTTGRRFVRLGARSHVKIIRIPTGEAPVRVRRAWVGLVLPCDPVMGYSPSGEKGVISERFIKSRIGVSVLQSDAIEALEKAGRHEAARYWKKLGYPRYTEGENCFGFGQREVRVLKPQKKSK